MLSSLNVSYFLVYFLYLSNFSRSFEIISTPTSFEPRFSVLLNTIRDDILIARKVSGIVKPFNSFNVSFNYFDCSGSIDEVCQKYANSAGVLYSVKNKTVLKALTSDQLSDQPSLRNEILKLFNNQNLIGFEKADEWFSLSEKKQMNNLVILFFSNQGSDFHQFILKQSLTFKNLYFYYTFNQSIVELFPSTEPEYPQIWIQVSHSQKILNLHYLPTSRRLKQVFQKLNNDNYYTMENDLQLIKKKSSHSVFSSLVLFIDPNRLEKSQRLLLDACIDLIDTFNCFIAENSEIDEVSEGKIILKIFSQRKSFSTELLAENPEEILQHAEDMLEFHSYFLATSLLKENPLIYYHDYISSEFELLHQQFRTETEEDDPMMFVTRSSEHLNYLVKRDISGSMLPRVNAAIYEELESGKNQNFTVLLFSLYFSQKSMAVLSHFLQIHNFYKKQNLSSSLIYVECDDWPNVCEKAGVYSYPKMVFYNSGSSSNVINYKGNWDIEDMKKSITLHSMESPQLIKSNQQLEELKSHGIVIIHGLINTVEGGKVFDEAARLLRTKYIFVKYSETELPLSVFETIKNVDTSKDLFGIDLNDDYSSILWNTISSYQDIVSSVDYRMSPPVVELNKKNFKKVINTTSIVMCATVSSPFYNKQIELLKSLALEAAKRNSVDVFFGWMNCEPDTTGYSIFQLYTDFKIPDVPISCIFKENVTVVSFDPSDIDLSLWIEDCLSGKLERTFRKPIVGPGEKFLSDDQLMKLEFDKSLKTPKKAELRHGFNMKTRMPNNKMKNSAINPDKQKSLHTEL